MALALDEQKDTDNVSEVEGYTFLVDNELLKETKQITVDFNPHLGFSISSELSTGGGDKSCSSCSSCG